MIESKFEISPITVIPQNSNLPLFGGANNILNAQLNLELWVGESSVFSLNRQTSFLVSDLQNPLLNPIKYLFVDYYTIRKEELYVTGIKNLRKNVNFLNLAKDLASKSITDEEFESEIDKNPDKYLIDINPMEDVNDAVILHEIVNKIGDDFTMDEAGDIFSFDSETIKDYLNKLSK